MIGVAVERVRLYDATKIYMDGFYCIFTGYLVIFALFLFSAEWEFLVVLKYFACLASHWGKGAFQIFIGILLYDYRNGEEIAASLFLVVVGVFNFLSACCTNLQNIPHSDRSSASSQRAILTRE